MSHHTPEGAFVNGFIGMGWWAGNAVAGPVGGTVLAALLGLGAAACVADHLSEYSRSHRR